MILTFNVPSLAKGGQGLRALFTLKILSHCSVPMREDQFGR